MNVNPNTVLLAVAVWPGLTSHQLAARLGLNLGHRRHQPYVYPVKQVLGQLAAAGYVRYEDQAGGRGSRGWRRAWYAEPISVGEG